MKKSLSSQTLVPSQKGVPATREQPKKILRIDTWTSSDSCLKPAEFSKTSKSKLLTANSFKTKGSILTPLTTLKSATNKETFSASKLLPKNQRIQEIPHIKNFAIHLDEKTNTNLTSAELSKQLTEDNSSWFSEKKFFPQSSLNKSESPKKLYTSSSHTQTISQKPKEGKKGCSEFRELQQRISKLLDKTQEKLKLEEIRDLSPQRKEMQHVFDEIEDLRKLTHSQSVIKKRKELPPAFEKLARQQNQTLYEMNRDQSNFNNSISTSHLEAKTPILDMSPNVRRDKQPAEESLFTEANTTFSRIRTQDPFDKMILYQDNKMPFSLALMAKMRHKMFNEVKQQNPIQIQEVDKTSVITVLREKLVPEEKAKFLEKLDEVEKLKKYNEMKSKKANTSAIYQLIALNKTSQKRLQSKMKEQFPVNSRFLKL